MIQPEFFRKFLIKFPTLLSAVQLLNKNSVDWLIGGSSCLYVLGNLRVPDDVDILLPDEQHDIVDEMFGITSYEHTSIVEKVRNSNPGGEHAIKLTSHLEQHLDRHYSIKINDLVMQKKLEYVFEGERFYFFPPEDVLLIKALLQRGPEVGKHDVEDIHNFMSIFQIDKNYLDLRIQQLQAKNRVKGIFAYI